MRNVLSGCFTSFFLILFLFGIPLYSNTSTSITGTNMKDSTSKLKKEDHMQTQNRKSGIVFMETLQLESLKRFYVQKVGCSLWQDQKDCVIFQHGDFLFGFCLRESADTSSLLTFFYEDRQEVDRMYEIFKDSAVIPPKVNPKYGIYHFFAKDPEGRLIEFQYFLNPVKWEK